MNPARSDAALVEDLIAGRPGAFEEFVELYWPKLFQYSYLMCGQREDAEEVTQETLLKVFEKLDQLREPERFKAWVFRIARNACYMKRRKSVFAPVQELSLDELMPVTQEDGDQRRLEIADWSSLPEDIALQSELRERLEAAIQSLPEIYRAVLILRDIEGLSTQETAEVLDITEDAVKTRLHRARLAVRSYLDEYLRTAGART